MTEATVFRLYADEALRESSKAERAEERQALEDLALTWAESCCGERQSVRAGTYLMASMAARC
jgi:hypothetical protein